MPKQFEVQSGGVGQTSTTQSLQEQFAAKSICFGCGPANRLGLHIRSCVENPLDPKSDVVAEWTPEPYHEAFPGVLNGGIIGALLDCHSNWTAAWHLTAKNPPAGTEILPPCTVTSEFSVKLLRPTPTVGVIRLRAEVSEADPGQADRAVIDATLEAGGKICATCRGTFVAVKPGHPAYHRW